MLSLELRQIDIKDREHFDRLVKGSDYFSCEDSFTNLYSWACVYKTVWGCFKDITVVYFKTLDDLLMPLTPKAETGELVDIAKYFRKQGENPRFFRVPANCQEKKTDLEEFFSIKKDDAATEYLHRTERMAELKGRKLRKKRNLISQFGKEYPSAHIEPLNTKNMEDCFVFAAEWARGKSISASYELCAIRRSFEKLDDLAIEGVCLYNQDRLLAFSIYSIYENMAVVHFEKARRKAKGAAQEINRAAAEALQGRVEWINREQDMGIPGLRKAKMSYDPDLLLESYSMKLSP